MRGFTYSIVLFCLFIKGFAQEAQWKLDSTHFLMGAPLNATLVVKGIPAHTQILFPYFAEDSTASIDFIQASEVDSSNQSIQQQMVHFMAFDTGWIYLPKAMLLVQKNNAIDTLYAKPLRVHVFSLPIDTLKSFRINKPLLDVPYHWREFIVWYALAILVLLLILLIIWLIKRPKSKIPATIITPEVKLSAYERARRELLMLENSELLKHGKEKEFQTNLTDILRQFLFQQFNIAALEATSDDIIERSVKHIRGAELEILRSILTQADLIKFAKQSIPTEEHWHSLRLAFQFIEVFKPIETTMH